MHVRWGDFYKIERWRWRWWRRWSSNIIYPSSFLSLSEYDESFKLKSREEKTACKYMCLELAHKTSFQVKVHFLPLSTTCKYIHIISTITTITIIITIIIAITIQLRRWTRTWLERKSESQLALSGLLSFSLSIFYSSSFPLLPPWTPSASPAAQSTKSSSSSAIPSHRKALLMSVQTLQSWAICFIMQALVAQRSRRLAPFSKSAPQGMSGEGRPGELLLLL